MTLLDRIEAATPDQQADLLREVWEALNPGPIPDNPQRVAWLKKRHRFYDMLDVAAYVDAALSMVPFGYDASVSLFGGDGNSGCVWKHGYYDDTAIYGDGSTPALALLAAIVRAIGKDQV